MHWYAGEHKSDARFEAYAEQCLPRWGRSFGRCLARTHQEALQGFAVARLDGKGCASVRQCWAELVSANYFDVLKVRPILGRTFLPEEGTDQPGAFPVAVISYRMWQNRYHADRNVLGKVIRLNRHELTIIGVAAPEFRGSTVGLVYDVWMPITMAAEMGNGNTLNYRARPHHLEFRS